MATSPRRSRRGRERRRRCVVMGRGQICEFRVSVHQTGDTSAQMKDAITAEEWGVKGADILQVAGRREEVCCLDLERVIRSRRRELTGDISEQEDK